ncbi:hypothetical protein E2C01_037323 [Portunus trituberculatus]|uniref:Uncharacterized protein n=1 Tax=Portunus trituberculatus TaxID=210409 RepID=A0A5B7F919_PORTR|nr:hypothetical protein [Portunus trituberculatus]
MRDGQEQCYPTMVWPHLYPVDQWCPYHYTMLVFLGMITIASVSDTHLWAERLTEVIVSGMEVYFPHSSLNVNLPNLSLTRPFLMLYIIKKLLTKGT